MLTPGSGLNAGTAMTGVEIRHYAANEIGCTANGGFPADYFAGAVALIQRGTCTFEEKINNAQARRRGARDHLQQRGRRDQHERRRRDLPAYSIQQAEGAALVAFIDSLRPRSSRPHLRRRLRSRRLPAIAAVVDFTPAVQQGDVIAGFSLRGPSALTSVTKPDITGPGVNIYAALDSATTGGYGYLSGTSMSSPHLAGAGALVRAAHPDWTPAEVEVGDDADGVHQRQPGRRHHAVDPGRCRFGSCDLTKAALAGFV